MIRKQSFQCLLSLALVPLVAGCIPSLNALYTEEDRVFEPALVGVWKQTQGAALWDFRKLDENSYRLIHTDDQGEESRFLGRLVRLEGELFLDVRPELIAANPSGFYNFHVLPIHTIYRIRGAAPNFQVTAIDFQWLDDHLAGDPQDIEYATVNGRKIITSPTPTLRKFVAAHKDRFTTPFALQRVERQN